LGQGLGFPNTASWGWDSLKGGLYKYPNRLNWRVFPSLDNQENEKIASYLKGKKLSTFTFDLDRGVFLFHNVEVDEQGKVNLKLISEVPVSLEHLDLLKRSL
jgi:hypothetical protein